MPQTATKPSAFVVDTSASPHVRLRPVPLGDVGLTDPFWSERQTFNREVTLPTQHDSLEATGGLDNFRRASGRKEEPGDFYGFYFNDTDVYKWLEAASYVLATRDDPALERRMDVCIDEIEAAQRDDGYLDTYFELERAGERWTNPDLHELYCAGHLFQAAVAHHRATGGTRLLDVARRFADHVCATFGPREEGRRPWVGGHEEVELGLVELYRATGERRYLDQAIYFVEARGRGLARHRDPEYSQDHAPIREMATMVGHAVRAVYYTAAVADLYAETGDEGYREACERLWANMTERRTYVSGGIGARYDFEAFGKDFELPNERAYTETCAAIGSVMWNWRMLQLDGDARYADLLEWTLWNAVLPGWSLDGRGYFYQNPLADDGGHRRQTWFYCACCPPNVARLVASLAGYVYGVDDDGVWVHLYAGSELDTTLPDGRRVRLRQTGDYPRDGRVTVRVGGGGRFALRLRVPGWCERAPEVRVNGEAAPVSAEPGTYLVLERDWREGDAVELDLPMEVRYLEAHPWVEGLEGRAAVARGPLLYCLETVDNEGIDLRDAVLVGGPGGVGVESSADLGGVVRLRLDGEARHEVFAGLYRRLREPEVETTPRTLVAVPYYAWANRAPGRMQVWTRRRGA